MALELERLVYRSTATGTTASLVNLAVILGESQRNNDRDGLTGALVAHNDRYIQVVEGPAQTLDGLLRRLGGDPRHRDIVIIDRAPADARVFGAWSMASARVTPALTPYLDAIIANEQPSAGWLVEALRDSLAASDDDRI